MIKEDKKRANPFYNNYIFSKEDISRTKIKKWRYPILWFLPTYHQSNDGYSFFFKQNQGMYFLMKVTKEI